MAKPFPEKRSALLRAWIDSGAAWPENPSAPSIDRRDYWSFKAPPRPEVPQTKRSAWPRNEVDRFVLARLEKEELSPSAEADKRTLLRRLSFDVTGLPPTPHDLERFLSDPNENAYDYEVDRLLNSPRYGERWARYWLDTIHFGETHGYDKDKTAAECLAIPRLRRSVAEH